MDTITVSKIEYKKLKKQADAFKLFAGYFFASLVADSPQDVINDFRKTNLYTESFLKDLKEGLADSSYLKNYGDKTTKTKIRNVPA
ncbi:hypothetical protein COU05_01330 [bacterium (Candidatus Gribaldobacteria) CG10_big_fil_rev_8_21_14_0_10_37_21]|uniref:Uncharacterized protein n=1 Tax=bacterium (Candidatus Gribaldobacteria) CG10_big_fil_rev_8_21_14_0_10_37_21 TaxID=2014275 RepID=A0A2H0UWK9_9BACT|nr:MAG: hypothetical protein AUJ25_03410 [Parcubacteria group bacterium CG1_02_37_13]PIR90569.1 MAG: hypothetical protein COU05_01330 [bacterium (Candidatus Gribaldobacteria) CG10_big_fil_rev_8_21_14_0_10_37_21]